MTDKDNVKAVVGDMVKLIGAPFDKIEATVMATSKDAVKVAFELNGMKRDWTAKTGEYVVLKDTPAPEVVIPAGLSFDPDGWEDRGYHAIATRIDNGVYNNRVRYMSNDEAKAMSKVGVRAWRDAYHVESSKLMDLFKNDLLVAYDLDKHPAVEFWRKLVDKAWNDEHSGGFGSILHTFDDMLDLFIGYDVVVGGRN